MLLHKAVREVNAGEIVEVLATDPSTERDIPNFCHFLGHQLLQQTTLDGNYVYLVQKRPDQVGADGG